MKMCIKYITGFENKLIAYANHLAIKFYLKHHKGRGKVALGFGPDRIRTLASMATDSSHRVIVRLMLC